LKTNLKKLHKKQISFSKGFGLNEFFCHIERSRDVMVVLDCARTDNPNNL